MDEPTPRSISPPPISDASTPSASGERQPAQPDALLDILHVLAANHHADRAVYAGVSRACRACRDWVLSNAPRATLTLEPPTDRDSLQQWHAQVQPVQRALQTRGAEPTSLTVMCGKPRQVALAGFALAAVRGTPHTITDLTVRSVRAQQQPRHRDVTAFLHQASLALPITTLTLDTCVSTLPPPVQLPQLSHLTLHTTGEQSMPSVMCNSIAVHLSQLAALTVENWIVRWPALFSQQPTHTLTSLSAKDSLLDDVLVCAVVESAPALRQLSVHSVSLASCHSEKRWALD